MNSDLDRDVADDDQTNDEEMYERRETMYRKREMN